MAKLDTSTNLLCVPTNTRAGVANRAPANSHIVCPKSFSFKLRSTPRRHRFLCRSGEFDAEEQKPDFIERMVSGIFGKKALENREPMGMKRMSYEDFPEMYPATTTEFAGPVESDDEEMALIRPLLARTQLEHKPLLLCYSANECGWSPDAFHSCVDSMGAAVVVAKTEGGAVIGGYNPKGWIGLGEDRDSVAAFLFTWPDGDVTRPATKLPKAGGPSIAVVDKPDGGIQFGAEGLTIPLGSTGADPRLAKCRLGTFYERLPDGGRSLFAEHESIRGAALTDLKVFVAQGSGEEWDLQGIVWNTRTG
uniref:TLDc domain-containing protein n=1 Tax=Tetraselmis sp. GSL018 TaxID=582737 RepID=A0A061R4X3_9CHLO